MVEKMFSVNGKMKKAVQRSGVLILGRNCGLRVSTIFSPNFSEILI